MVLWIASYIIHLNYIFKLAMTLRVYWLGPALALREAYFGELVIDEQVLNQHYQIIASTHSKKFST